MTFYFLEMFTSRIVVFNILNDTEHQYPFIFEYIEEKKDILFILIIYNHIFLR